MPGKPGKPVVVDASVVVKWFVPEEYSEAALKILRDHLNGRVEVHAPTIVLAEAANALRKYVVRSYISREHALRALRLLLETGLKLTPVSGLVDEALRVALDAGATVYDAAYVVLARRLNTILYTADERLVRMDTLSRIAVIRHIVEYGG